MKVTKEQHAKVIERLEEVIAIAEAHYNTTFKFPSISYKVTGRVAGTATFAYWAVDFNLPVYTRHGEDFIKRTVAHEMAHLICGKVYPESRERVLKCYRYSRKYGQKMPVYKAEPHGAQWKSVMRVLGLDPSRCHSYDLEGLVKRKKRETWVCSQHGSEMNLGPKQHKTQLAHASTGYYTPRKTACNRHCIGLFVHRTSAPAQMPIAAQTKAPSRKTSGESNKSKAAKLFFLDSNRANFIRRCEGEGIKKATASTYHHNFKSGKWSI